MISAIWSELKSTKRETLSLATGVFGTRLLFLSCCRRRWIRKHLLRWRRCALRYYSPVALDERFSMLLRLVLTSLPGLALKEITSKSTRSTDVSRSSATLSKVVRFSQSTRAASGQQRWVPRFFLIFLYFFSSSSRIYARTWDKSRAGPEYDDVNFGRRLSRVDSD